MAESPYHFVYELVEKIDETKMKLEEIEPHKRSSQENEFIRFIKGRLYKNGSRRSSVIDAVVPGTNEISILDKHIHLDVWREWFDRVTQHNLTLCGTKISFTFFI